jgi:hypothetical protein
MKLIKLIDKILSFDFVAGSLVCLIIGFMVYYEWILRALFN